MDTMQNLLEEYKDCLNHIANEQVVINDSSLMNQLTNLLMIAQKIYSNAILEQELCHISSSGSMLQNTVSIIVNMGELMAQKKFDMAKVRNEVAPILNTMKSSRMSN